MTYDELKELFDEIKKESKNNSHEKQFQDYRNKSKKIASKLFNEYNDSLTKKLFNVEMPKTMQQLVFTEFAMIYLKAFYQLMIRSDVPKEEIEKVALCFVGTMHEDEDCFDFVNVNANKDK